MPYITSIERMAIEEGLQEGRQEGLQEGLQQGKRSGLLLGLELALDVKFGDASRTVVEEMQQIEDVTVLEAIAQRLRIATTVDEVRAIYQRSIK